MAECELLKTCTFFNDTLANQISIANLYKNNYCKGEFETCARFMIANSMGRENIPSNLFPNMTDRAQEIINSK